MPRKQETLAALYGDVQMQKRGALQAAADDTRARLIASIRPDFAGAPINQYLTPQTYQGRVQQVWSAYGTDPLFGRLVNRFVEFSANGSSWEVPSEPTNQSWLEHLKHWVSGRDAKVEREEDVWNLWSTQLNKGVPNVLPGINEVVRWAVKHMLLSGMFVPHWKLGEITIGKQSYLVPKELICYPASAITLSRSGNSFSNETAYHYRPSSSGPMSVYEGAFSEAPNFIPFGAAGSANSVPLPSMEKDAKVGATESFVLKYNWSPGDIVSYRRGTVNVMGTGIYPTPPFHSLLQQFAIRQKLFAADAAILDGLINFIMLYRVGDKDHPPKPPQKKADGTIIEPGTIETVRRLIQEGQAGPGMQLFVPYYVALEILTPDTAALLSDAKYGASATEIFQAFGIFFSRTQSGSRERMEKVTLSGFEEFIAGIRFQVKAFLELLAWHIVEINKGKLKTIPQWSPNPINTKSEQFIKDLLELKKFGMISTKSLLRYIGLDDDVEIRRTVAELAKDVDDIQGENVPVSFVQQTVQPDTGGKGGKPTPPTDGGPPTGKPARTRKTVAIPPTKQMGRPRS
jgi:hypothetical protein